MSFLQKFEYLLLLILIDSQLRVLLLPYLSFLIKLLLLLTYFLLLHCSID